MNIRNRFFRKKENQEGILIQEKISKLLRKEGFYIILFLCVCVVAVTAVWVTKMNIERLRMSHMEESFEMDAGQEEFFMEDAEEGNSIVTVEEIDEESGVMQPIQESTEKNQPIQEKAAESSKTNPAPKNASAVAETKEQTAAAYSAGQSSSPMKMPVKGKIGMDYAVDTLTYSKTLEQYMTHHGIDIIAPEGTPVVAALDGEVVEIVVDSGLGITIGLAHEGNLITRYANLSTADMVKIGDRVKKGQTISGIGTSGLFEKLEEPHLHFEVLLNGKHVDPKKYLPIR